MSHKILRAAFGCASLIAMAAAATPASAQQVKDIIAFGDSYADTGNAFKLGYANPSALQVYPTGRFSGGTNYIDTLSKILNVPVSNFAIGGAFGGANSGTLCYDPYYAPGTSPLCGKGLQYQVDQFLNVGTQSTVFPTPSTTLTQNDLVAISIGGNDARFYQQAGGTLAGAGAAGTAAGTATGVQIDRIAAAGNPTISFLALNGAVAPEVALNPTAQQIRGAYATAYYNTLQASLAGDAARGSIVHYLDGQLLLQNISANPAAYGITNGLVCPTFPTPTCAINSDGYLFYGDALHLTSQGFQIVGQYVAAQLRAPLTLQASGDLGLDTAKQWGRTLSSRSDLSRGNNVAGLRLFAVGDLFQRDVPVSDSNNAFEIRGGGGTLGAEYGMAGATVGIAANYSKPQVRFGNDSARINSHTLQVGAYGNVDLGGIFAEGHLGYGKDHNRLTRTGVLTDMNARAGGNHVVAGAKGGYLMPFGVARIGPIVALDYARAKVNGYTEGGDPALTLNVGRQSLKSTTGRLGAEIRGDFAQLHGFLDGAVEHEFSGDARTISFAQTSAPMIVNSWNLANSKQTYGRISGGLYVNLTPGVSMNLTASSTVSRKHGDEAGAQVGLKAGF